MAFETRKFNVVKKKKLEKSTFAVECNIENNIEIEKILSVCHSAMADSAEVLNGVVNYTGYIDFCVLYLTVDGEVGTLSSACPFTSKFEDSDIAVGDRVGISVSVEDYQIESVTSSNIKIGCTIVQSGELIKSCEVTNISSDDEDICQKEDELLVNTLVGEANETFEVESEISIKEPVRKVICTDSQVTLKNVESGVNFVSVTGEIVTRLLYLTENDRFETSYTTENFKEEVELEGVEREAVSEATLSIRQNAVKCEIDNAEKGITVHMTIPVKVRVVAYLEKAQSVVNDIYSTSCNLNVATSSFEMTKEEPTDMFEEKIDGTLTLDDDKPRVDKVMFVGGSNLNVTNSYIKNGEVFVEGVTKTNVVYLNDESNALVSVVVEVPFVVSDKTNYDDNTQVSVTATLTDVDVVVKKGREFLFDAKIKATVNYFSDNVGAVISGVEMSDAYEERDYAIELVFASAGQSAWDIAKAVKVKEETVLMQNPDVIFPLEKDENIVVYYKIR